MGKKLLLIGGGGHCHSVLDSVRATGEYERVGIVAKDADNLLELKADALSSPYLVGTDDELESLHARGWIHAFVTLGSVGNPVGRKRIYAELVRIGFNVPVIADPTAVVSETSKLAPGTFVGKKAVVNAGSCLGTCSIINSGAIIEHDCSIGSFAHISPGAVVCGNVSVGEDAHIGAGAVVRQGISIGRDALIGAGSVVVKDIPDSAKAYGNPCRVVS